jgi:hypothetical protein
MNDGKNRFRLTVSFHFSTSLLTAKKLLHLYLQNLNHQTTNLRMTSLTLRRLYEYSPTVDDDHSTESLLLLESLELPLISSSELDELELSSLLDSLSLFLDLRFRDLSFDCATFFP